MYLFVPLYIYIYTWHILTIFFIRISIYLLPIYLTIYPLCRRDAVPQVFVSGTVRHLPEGRSLQAPAHRRGFGVQHGDLEVRHCLYQACLSYIYYRQDRVRYIHATPLVTCQLFSLSYRSCSSSVCEFWDMSLPADMPIRLLQAEMLCLPHCSTLRIGLWQTESWPVRHVSCVAPSESSFDRSPACQDEA